MPAYRVPPGLNTPSVADFAVGGLMTAAGPATAKVLPGAKDALTMLQQLKGNLSLVPESAQKLIGPAEQYFQFPKEGLQAIERMYQQASPIFKKLAATGMFGHGY